MRTVSLLQVDLRLALTLPGEADVEIHSTTTDETLERLTLVRYNGLNSTGNGHDFLVRAQDGEMISRSAVDLGLTDGADRIAFFATNPAIPEISVA